MNKLTKKMMKVSVLSALLLSATQLWAGEKVDETVATSADGRVSIDVLTGKVFIKTWDKNEVRVVGELDDNAEGYVFDVSSSRVEFVVNMPNQRWGNWKESDAELTFYVPKMNDVRFEGVNVSVDIKDVAGGAKINTVNGNIVAANLAKRVRLETVNGKIDSTNLNGRIHLATVNGKVTDKNSQGELNIEAVNGDIKTQTVAKEVTISNVNGDMRLDLNQVAETEISSVNGDIEIDYSHDGKAKVNISTVGGEVDVLVAPSLSASFNIEAHSGGDISNNITSDRPVKERYGPGESLRFEIGSGQVEFTMDTVNGDINLLKKRK